ncbi:prolipoprotein diacylglyceryl transferase [Tenacibaculum sp. 190524A05c]|uniref:prolipoprotein diacylglyceryl transferase n=1 Tax=Tenacibaculum platacis TaxID=3137852 RepID=UPI0032B2A45E
MDIPFEPIVFGFKINIHLILEYLAFFLGYRYYAYLKKNSEDVIPSSNRLYIILGAAIGALLGSRIIGVLEHPFAFTNQSFIYAMNSKTIMGGLFGGLLGVEIAKKIIGERHSSGDLFTLPIVFGIFIGRIGCFLTGVNEFTYGRETNFFLGMDLGDGVIRHPLALYELIFLVFLFLFLKSQLKRNLESGEVFKLFMLFYFGFRFMIEFLKPNAFFILGLSTIQILCITCWLYYYKFILKAMKNAR